MHEVSKNASVLLACIHTTRRIGKHVYGLVALMRSDINRDNWFILFSTTGEGNIKTAMKHSSDFLKDYLLTGSVIVEDTMLYPADLEECNRVLNSNNLIQEVTAVKFIQNFEPVVGQAIYAASAAMTTMYNNHNFVAKLQETGRAVSSQ